MLFLFCQFAAHLLYEFIADADESGCLPGYSGKKAFASTRIFHDKRQWE